MGCVCERGDGGLLRDHVGIECVTGAVEALGDIGRREGKADAEAGEGVGLGEGAGHDEVGPERAEVEPGRRGAVGAILDVGLIEDHKHMFRYGAEEGLERCVREVGAGGVVGVGNEEEAGLVGAGRGHGLQVVSEVEARHDGGRHAEGVERDLVGDEGELGDDGVVISGAEGDDELFDDFGRTVAEQDLFGGHGESGRDGLAEGIAGRIGIEMNAPGCGLHRGDGRGRRAVGVLVAGQLDDASDAEFAFDLFGRLARRVGVELVDPVRGGGLGSGHGEILRQSRREPRVSRASLDPQARGRRPPRSRSQSRGRRRHVATSPAPRWRGRSMRHRRRRGASESRGACGTR